MTDNGTRLVVRRFPPELHRRLRIVSASTGEDMREIVIAAVTDALAEREQRLAQEAALGDPGAIPVRRTGLGPFGLGRG
jgi:plasmid stability protein